MIIHFNERIAVMKRIKMMKAKSVVTHLSANDYLQKLFLSISIKPKKVGKNVCMWQLTVLLQNGFLSIKEIKARHTSFK